LVDIHFGDKRPRIGVDKQGRPLDTYERAYDLLAHIKYEIDNQIFDPAKYIKSEQKEFYISTQLERYSDFKINSLAPSYQTDFKRYIRMAKDFFNTKDVREVRKADIVKYQQHLGESFNLSNKTIKNIMDVFKAFLNYLRNDLELTIPVLKFPYIEIEVKPIKWYAQDDQIKLYDAVPEAFRDVIGFLILHGCRPSEARALKCKDTNVECRQMTISATFSGTVYREKRKGKKSKPVTIPIHPEFYDFVANRVKNNHPEAFLFVNPYTGRPFGKNSLDRMWARVRRKAGIGKEVRLYDFTRHSFASNHLNQGTSIYKVSKLMGHSSVKMTEKYGHADMESLRVEVPKLSLKRHQSVIRRISGDK